MLVSPRESSSLCVSPHAVKELPVFRRPDETHPRVASKLVEVMDHPFSCLRDAPGHG